MNFKYTYKKSDYKDLVCVLNKVLARLPFVCMQIPIGLFFFLMGLHVVKEELLGGVFTLFIGFAVTLVGTRLGYKIVRLRVRFRKYAQLGPKEEWIIDESRIRIKSADREMAWRDLKSVYYLEEGVVLVGADFVWLPWDAIADSDCQKYLFDLIESNSFIEVKKVEDGARDRVLRGL